MYRQVITGLTRRGAKAIILACIEISLLLKSSDVAIPVVDTTAIHAEAAVEFALSSERCAIRKGDGERAGRSLRFLHGSRGSFENGAI
jgi:hypothetical protein